MEGKKKTKTSDKREVFECSSPLSTPLLRTEGFEKYNANSNTAPAFNQGEKGQRQQEQQKQQQQIPNQALHQSLQQQQQLMQLLLQQKQQQLQQELLQEQQLYSSSFTGNTLFLPPVFLPPVFLQPVFLPPVFLPPEISSEPGKLVPRSNLYPQEQLDTIPRAVKNKSLEQFNLEPFEHGKRRRDSSAPLTSLKSDISHGQPIKKACDPNSHVVLSSERALQRTASAQNDLFGNERYHCEVILGNHMLLPTHVLGRMIFNIASNLVRTSVFGHSVKQRIESSVCIIESKRIERALRGVKIRRNLKYCASKMMTLRMKISN